MASRSLPVVRARSWRVITGVIQPAFQSPGFSGGRDRVKISV